MLIPRMWRDEVERIGKQKCTPVGYMLHGIGDLIGFVGFLLLIALPLYLTSLGFVGSFKPSLLWLLAVPFIIGILGSTIVAFSWSLAFRKNFHYDYERRESTWIEAGEKRSYTFADTKAAACRHGK